MDYNNKRRRNQLKFHSKEIILQNDEIISYLERGRNKSNNKRKIFPSDIIDRIDIMKEKAEKLFEPKSVNNIFLAPDLPDRECFREAEQVALAVVTIGDKLPVFQNSKSSNGSNPESVVGIFPNGVHVVIGQTVPFSVGGKFPIIETG